MFTRLHWCDEEEYWTSVLPPGRIVMYASIIVMTSFYYASAPTRNNCFQTNQPEHESDDHTDSETSMCVNTDEKDTAL